MPCFTQVTVEVKDLQIANDTANHFQINGNSVREVNGKVEVTLPSSITKAEFKNEYGLRVAEREARRKYGSRVRVWRSVNEKYKTQQLNIQVTK
jgi:hypothetical protein